MVRARLVVSAVLGIVLSLASVAVALADGGGAGYPR
jgi:hypothetical protein